MSELTSEYLDWSQTGWKTSGDSHVFYVMLSFCPNVYIHLAEVKQTNDRRWTWIRKTSQSFPVPRKGPAQGVCQHLYEAKAKAVEDLLPLMQTPGEARWTIVSTTIPQPR